MNIIKKINSLYSSAQALSLKKSSLQTPEEALKSSLVKLGQDHLKLGDDYLKLGEDYLALVRDFNSLVANKSSLEGKRCLSCGKFVPKKYWKLPEEDVNGCGVRPLCGNCS